MYDTFPSILGCGFFPCPSFFFRTSRYDTFPPRLGCGFHLEGHYFSSHSKNNVVIRSTAYNSECEEKAMKYQFLNHHNS